MDPIPCTGKFRIARYSHISTAPGEFNQFDNFDSVTDLEYRISSPVLNTSIGPRGREEYCDDNDDSDNESDSDVENISALINSAPNVVKKNPKIFDKKNSSRY